MQTSTTKGAPWGPLLRATALTGHAARAVQAKEQAGLKTNHSPTVGFQLEQVSGLVEQGAVQGKATTTQGGGGTV